TLAALTRLAFLDVSSTGITSAGLRALAPLAELEQLDLAFLDLDDADVAFIAKAFPKLRCLSLGFSRRITDAACETLAGLPAVRRLDLASTEITTAGIDRLSRTEVAELGLEGCTSEVVELARAHDGWAINARDLLELWDDADDSA